MKPALWKKNAAGNQAEQWPLPLLRWLFKKMRLRRFHNVSD